MAYTTEQINKVRTLAAQQIDTKSISVQLNIPISHLYKIGHRNGIKFKRAENSWRSGPYPNTLKRKIDDSIRLLEANGYSVRRTGT